MAEEELARRSPAALAEARWLLDGESLVRASTWADHPHRTEAGGHTAGWHWMDLEDGEPLAERLEQRPAELASEEPQRRDLLDALRTQRQVLADRDAPRGERARALRFLVHLVADAHQPLHVGRSADRGGNLVEVRWFGEPTNLHRVWDLHLLDWNRLSYSEWAELLPPVEPERLAAWRSDGMEVWLEESRSLRPEVYAIGDGNLGAEYAVEHLPVVERRLHQAGVRLAAWLGEVLGRPRPGGRVQGRTPCRP